MLAWRFFDYFVCFILSIWIGNFVSQINAESIEKLWKILKIFKRANLKLQKSYLKAKIWISIVYLFNLCRWILDLDCNCLSFFMYWISIWRLVYSAIEIMINLFQLWWIHFFIEKKHSISFGEEIFFSEFWYPVWIVVVVVVCRHRGRGHDFCKR